MFALVGAAFFIAALLPTYVLSRVFLVFFWRSESGPATIAGCHVGAFLFCALIGAIGFAAGDAGSGGPNVMLAIVSFALPQFAWLVTDLYKFERKHGHKRAYPEMREVHRSNAGGQFEQAALQPPEGHLLLPPPDQFGQGRMQ